VRLGRLGKGEDKKRCRAVTRIGSMIVQKRCNIYVDLRLASDVSVHGKVEVLRCRGGCDGKAVLN